MKSKIEKFRASFCSGCMRKFNVVKGQGAEKLWKKATENRKESERNVKSKKKA